MLLYVVVVFVGFVVGVVVNALVVVVVVGIAVDVVVVVAFAVVAVVDVVAVVAGCFHIITFAADGIERIGNRTIVLQAVDSGNRTGGPTIIATRAFILRHV